MVLSPPKERAGNTAWEISSEYRVQHCYASGNFLDKEVPGCGSTVVIVFSI